jgi:hypothetical protein
MSDQYHLRFTHRPTSRKFEISFRIYDRKERQLWRDIHGALERNTNFEDLRIVIDESTETEVEL